MPEVKFSLFCESMLRNQKTHHYSLINVFNKIRMGQEPFSFILVVYWTGKVGETFVQSASLVDNFGNSKAIGGNSPITLTDVIENMGVFRFENVVFDRPGRYVIEVQADEKLTAKIPAVRVDTFDGRNPTIAPIQNVVTGCLTMGDRDRTCHIGLTAKCKDIHNPT